MIYDKINRKVTKLNDEIGRLKEVNNQLIDQNEIYKSALNGVMHETRRLSSELSDYAEQISKLTTTESRNIKELSDTIFYTSEMLASRLAFTDLELNPTAIHYQHKVRTSLYKKFHKASYILNKQAKSKQIKLKLSGNSNQEFDAIEAFHLVPFVILDNAIKYSPRQKDIDILFEEQQRELEVVISSYGPKVDHDELLNIFKKGVRGRNGIKAERIGDGLGLYLAKMLCDLTSIKISATSNQQVEFTMNGINYSSFEIKLTRRF